ncbi:MAG: hypothetical protein AAF799_44500 [Myxococcota bacterium]
MAQSPELLEEPPPSLLLLLSPPPGPELLLPAMPVVGSGSVVFEGPSSLVLSAAVVPAVSEPLPAVPLLLPEAPPVAGGPWDTAAGEQSHSPKPEPSALHVRTPSSSSGQSQGCVSPGTHAHGGTSIGPSAVVLFIGSPEEPEHDDTSASIPKHAAAPKGRVRARVDGLGCPARIIGPES